MARRPSCSTAYKSKYGGPPIGSYPIYGVAAIQVILAAIAKSDGTRQSIIDQVFTGSGITIPASESVIGKAFSIDTKTGDVSAKDYSILQEEEPHGSVLEGSRGVGFRHGPDRP